MKNGVVESETLLDMLLWLCDCFWWGWKVTQVRWLGGDGHTDARTWTYILVNRTWKGPFNAVWICYSFEDCEKSMLLTSSNRRRFLMLTVDASTQITRSWYAQASNGHSSFEKYTHIHWTFSDDRLQPFLTPKVSLLRWVLRFPTVILAYKICRSTVSIVFFSDASFFPWNRTIYPTLKQYLPPNRWYAGNNNGTE